MESDKSSGSALQGAGGGTTIRQSDVKQNAKLTAAEFELYRQIGPRSCSHAVGAELIVNAPDYTNLPSGAKVVVKCR